MAVIYVPRSAGSTLILTPPVPQQPPPINVTWVTRDLLATWQTRDDKANWNTRDDQAAWKTRS
jgi:hypothetical protein